MTTAPYAKLRANIAGAGNLNGALVGAAGATCQLSQDPAGLGSSFLYQITDYPAGWPQPAGWSIDFSGVYYFQGLTPPSFTLPAMPLWGKLQFCLTVNNGDPGTSGLPATQFIDTTTAVRTAGPSGVQDVAFGETNQWDSVHNWIGALKANLRLFSLITGGAHGQVRAASAGALAAYTRSGGVITANANGAMATIDGVALAVGDRLLLKDGASGTDNAIYNVTSLGSAGTPWVLTWAEDFNSSANVRCMASGAVSEGTANGLKFWKLTTSNPITLGTTALTFVIGDLTVSVSSTPLTIISSTTPKLWLDSQLGAGTNTWSDQTANHFDMTEATHPPTLTTLGTVPCYTGNGTNQLFTASGLTLTLGNWYWMIVRQIAWSANASICGGSAATPSHTMLQDGSGSSPAVSIYNTGVVDQNPTAMTVGSWFRVMFKFDNTAASYLQVGASGNKVSGNPGALTGTGWNLFARAGANFGNVAIANVVVCPAEPTTGEKTALDAWYAAKAFGGVVGF